jgi:lysozyme
VNIEELLIKHEGRKNKPYPCTKGKMTIGVGWNMDDNPLPPDIASHLKAHGSITDEMIDRLLKIAIRHASADCRVLFPSWDSFSDNRKMALTDFVYNIGFSGVRKFKKMLAAVNSGDWKKAASELVDSNYFRQVPNRAAEIVKMIERG